MAEAFLKKRLPDSKIISAGLERATSGWYAEDLPEDIDIVLTMKKDQVRIIRRRFPKFKGIVKRLCDGTDVKAPYGYIHSVCSGRFVNRF